MNNVEQALNILTEITDEDIINSKHYEDAIMALCELRHKVEQKEEQISLKDVGLTIEEAAKRLKQ